MSDMRGNAKINSLSRASGLQLVRLTPDGSVFTADWLHALALEGRVFNASVGTATTPITFKTGYTTAQPELAVDVPSGTTIIPIYVGVYLEDSAGTDNEVVMLTSTTAVGAGMSTAITPKSSRTDNPIATNCSVYSAYSGNGTAPTVNAEFFRAGYAFADANTQPPKLFEYDVRRAPMQVVVGTGSLVVYVGGTTTAPAGFIKAVWAELPTATAVTLA